MSLPSSDGPEAPSAVAAVAVLPKASSDSPAAVLLVERATRRVVHANDLAVQLAPGVTLPAAVDDWSDAAGLRDMAGEELSETEHPLSQAAQGHPVPGEPVTALRASAATAVREPLFAVGLPLTGAPGLDGHSLVVLLPMRERSVAEQAVGVAKAESQLRDRAVLATGVSFTLADAQADDVPLQWVNPAFTATTGYTAAESVGRNCRFLQGPDTDRASVAELRDALRTGRDVTATLLNYRKDGTAFWNELAMSPVRDGSGTVTHFVGVQTDVTERVEADRARQAALDAERAAREDADRSRAEADGARREAEEATRTARRALRALEHSAQRLAVAAEVSGLMSATLDVDEALERLTEVVIPRLADWAVIALTGEQGTRAFGRHRDGREDLLARYGALLPAAVQRRGALHDLVSGGPPTLTARYEPVDPALLTEDQREVQDITVRLGARSIMLVPLVARRRVLGALMLVQGPSGRTFTEEDLEVATDLGARAGLAVDNARLYTREHEVALTLQRGLLPQLPEVPGLTLAAQYLPAAQDSQVGGDWWDVFALPDGATALAIGDVMGHDLAAAAAMGQLRSVLRTCAWAGDSPSVVLGRMDQLVQSFEMAQLATCIYARVEPEDTSDGRRRAPRLRWANAGHLPPVLHTPDGRVRLLPDAVSVPLGVPSGSLREHADVALPVGSTVLLYTDGLVETRSGDIDSDLRALVEDVGRHRSGDGPQALADRLVERRDLGNADDVALLAVQLR